MAQFALRFVVSDARVSTVILGARNPEQARTNSAAAMLGPLSDLERGAVDGVVPPGGGRKIWPA
jgi:aryl-alcohol dehydrogenase-like predicted oxidoreductase